MTLSREVKEADLLVYNHACPNCGGFISDRRLRLGLPCSSCIPDPDGVTDVESIYMELSSRGTLKEFKDVYEVIKSYKELYNFFRKCVGNDPWSIQRLWIRRVAKKASFAMIAPTGVGKTTFGAVVALYYALRGHKSYFMVPTTALAIQLEQRIGEMISRIGANVKCISIHSKLKRHEREEREEALRSGNGFQILITTSNYLLRNPERILKHDFKFIFIDDVDAILKGSKAINYVLNLFGFNEEDLKLAMESIRSKRELMYLQGVLASTENVEARKRLEERLNKLLEKLESIKERLERKRKELDKILIIASATGNPRGTRVKLFKELLGFEIGARPEFIRNIADSYILPRKPFEDEVVNLVKMLGKGGLIYVPIDKGVDYAIKLAGVLRDKGIRAEAVHSRNVEAIERFSNNEIDVLVGTATYYGILVRGIDLPEVIRYAVFVGVPRHKISLRLEGVKPQDILRLLPLVRDSVTDNAVKRQIDAYIVRLRRTIRRLGSLAVQIFTELLEGTKKPATRVEREFLEAYELLRRLLSDREIVEKIKSNPNVAVIEDRGTLYVLIPDAPTYIQASGRTSRLYLGGISRGLSVVIVDDERLLRGLERRLKWLIDEFSFTPFNELSINELLKEIDESRKAIRDIRRGVVPKEIIGREGPLTLKTALLIVESPNKARTIARFFGRPSVREYRGLRVYEANLGNYTLLITASGGHIYDLAVNPPKEVKSIYGIAVRNEGAGGSPFIPVYTTILKCRSCGKQFVEDEPTIKNTCKFCGKGTLTSSEEVIRAIRDVALEVDEILVGTDPDTEGEKIAFDITNIVYPVNRNVKRIEFHEVTRRAIINALKNPRDINYNLVKAQLVRRIEDRWIGFSLSTKLQTEFWRQFCSELRSLYGSEHNSMYHFKKTKGLEILLKRCEEYKDLYRNLSAGRVQTPVLGWIIDAYERHVKSKTLFLIIKLSDLRMEVELSSDLRKRIRREGLRDVIIKVDVESREKVKLNPLPPYTTDAALADISSKYGIPTSKAMQILQDLFELGFITYHRTDSTRVSDAGIAVAKEYLKERLGEEYEKYLQPRSWGEGGAHECIRPTRPLDVETLRNLINEGVIEPVKRLTRAHYLVYDLIFRRFMASQSKPAEVSKVKGSVKVTLKLNDGSEESLGPVDFEFYTNILFDGFSRFYRYFTIRPEPKEGVRRLRKGEYLLKEWYKEPLHTQSSLVKTMKEREIGRPSTYAKIIRTLFDRGYVIYVNIKGRSEGREKGVVPRPLGKAVYQYLQRNYEKLVSEERTRILERKMREVEEGLTEYEELLKELYNELKQFNLLGGEIVERR